MNIYTASIIKINDLATIANVGSPSAKKIVQLRDEVLAGKHAPTTVQDLTSIRLSMEDWQSLIDIGTIKIDQAQSKYITHDGCNSVGCTGTISGKWQTWLPSELR